MSPVLGSFLNCISVYHLAGAKSESQGLADNKANQDARPDLRIVKVLHALPFTTHQGVTKGDFSIRSVPSSETVSVALAISHRHSSLFVYAKVMTSTPRVPS